MQLLSFWSYVHADDEVDVGRVVQLGRDIVANYEAITTESLELFLDRDDLKWGDQWRQKVDESLSNVAFFIPVITPRYFTRPECRRELSFFANRTQKLNIRALILPLLYIDVPTLHQDDPDDELVKLVVDIQWTPWTELRFSERASSEYRSAVHKLAGDLVSRVAAVERVDILAQIQEAASDDAGGASVADDEAGFVDKMATLEAALPRWAGTLQAIAAEIERIGEIMNLAAVETRTPGQPGKEFAVRLTIARRASEKLDAPVTTIEELGKSYAVDLRNIDDGLRDLLRQGATEAFDANDEQALGNYCSFMTILRDLALQSGAAFDAMQELVEVSRPLDKLSRDMRPVLRRLRGSLTSLGEARQAIRSWVEYGDSLGVDCSSLS